MNEVIRLWEEKHPTFKLLVNTIPYMHDGINDSVCRITVWSEFPKEIVWDEDGKDFLTVYKRLEEDWHGK